jgi:hypothetical protein
MRPMSTHGNLIPMKFVTDLFDPEPLEWGLRGDPWVWRALAQHLSGTYIPPSMGEVERLIYASFDRVVGVDLSTETRPWIYRSQFDNDTGLSAGNIHLETWRVTLLHLLIERARPHTSG